MSELERLAGNPMEALPEPVRDLVHGLMDGSVVQFALAFHLADGRVYTATENPGDGSAFTLIGAVAVLQDDLLAQTRLRRGDLEG